MSRKSRCRRGTDSRGGLGRQPLSVQITSQLDPLAQEPESPSAAVVVEVRLDTLTLVVEGLMVKAGVVETALIPVALIPLLRAALIPLLRAALIPLLRAALIPLLLAEIVSISATLIATTVVAGRVAVRCPTSTRPWVG